MSTGSNSTANELERLAALRDQGVLTEEELTAQKQRILGSPSMAAMLLVMWAVYDQAGTPGASVGLGS